MQSENFDKRIVEAAENHHPSYDENAWAKMKSLLDEHMPVKEKRRRRFLIFFLFFIVAAGITWMAIDRPWEKRSSITKNQSLEQQINNPTTASGSKVDASQRDLQGSVGRSTTFPDASDQKVSGGDKPYEGAVTADPVITGIEARENNLQTAKDEVKQEPNKNIKSNKNVDTKQYFDKNEKSLVRNQPELSKKKQQPVANKKASAPIVKRQDEVMQKNDERIMKQGEKLKEQKKEVKKDQVVNKQEEIIAKRNEEEKAVIENNTDPKEEKVEELAGKDSEDEIAAADEKKNAEEDALDQAVKDSVMQKPANNSTSRKNAFFVSVSAGPDFSMVGMGKSGKVMLTGGIGLGYTFRERFTIRTGFYSGRKVYEAKPADYKPAMPLPNPDYLYRIDADCKVYEIPLNLSYNVLTNSKRDLFVGTGISSYIMKKEDYDYVYKYPGSDDEHHYPWVVNNENKHFFSVLSLSAGYTHKFGKRFSISAEPYFKIPLKGVGFGNVKLNSAGVLFSVNYQPFSR